MDKLFLADGSINIKTQIEGSASVVSKKVLTIVVAATEVEAREKVYEHLDRTYNTDLQTYYITNLELTQALE